MRGRVSTAIREFVATRNYRPTGRRTRLLDVLDRHRPDVVCLQEIRTTAQPSLLEWLSRSGYHVVLHGQKAYNGVAILSRASPSQIEIGMESGAREREARFAAVRVGDLRVLSVYAPNGKEVGSPSWWAKLAWFERLRRWLTRNADPQRALLLCGDLNVALEDRDVCDPEAWRQSVLFHADARRALASLMDWGLVDTFRMHNQDGGHFTWWSHRKCAFRYNRGLRIDFVLATRSVAQRCRSAEIDRGERGARRSSDHAPVFVDIDD